MNCSYSSQPTEHLAAFLLQLIGQNFNCRAQSAKVLAEDPAVVRYALIIHNAARPVRILGDRKTKDEVMVVNKIDRRVQFSMKYGSVSKESIGLCQKDWKEGSQQTVDWTVPVIRNASGDRLSFSF